jgi:hypothetical protein
MRAAFRSPAECAPRAGAPPGRAASASDRSACHRRSRCAWCAPSRWPATPLLCARPGQLRSPAPGRPRRAAGHRGACQAHQVVPERCLLLPPGQVQRHPADDAVDNGAVGRAQARRHFRRLRRAEWVQLHGEAEPAIQRRAVLLGRLAWCARPSRTSGYAARYGHERGQRRMAPSPTTPGMRRSTTLASTRRASRCC